MRGARPSAGFDARVGRGFAFGPHERVIVALSGGPDSVVLAGVADRFARRWGFALHLAHVNHGTRDSAWQDEAVALAVGARLDRETHVCAVLGATSEAALRSARYAALATLAAQIGAGSVLTAHTAEDQTETVLLALFRGTGLDGMAGMPERRPLTANVVLVRPFLRLTHAQLRTELGRLGLPSAVDPTNAQPIYRRNALRTHLAALRLDFPDLDAAVARAATIIRDEREGDPRAQARRRVRTTLRMRGLLRDVPFERIEAAIDAPNGRVFLRAGVEWVNGDIVTS